MTIIATTDFSDIAQNAVQYAAALANAIKAKLVLFNAFTPPIHASNAHLSADTFQKLLDSNKERLNELAVEFKSKYQLEVETESNYSFIEEHLTALIEKYQADIIIFGMAEKSIEQELMGNTTTSAIKNIDIPIISVPLQAKFNGLAKMVFACDTRDDIPEHAKTLVRSITNPLNTEIEVFSVDTTVENIKKQPKEERNLTDETFTYFYKNVQSTEVLDAIRKEIKDVNADILVMMPKKYGFWGSMVHTSKTRIMASGLHIPLFSIPASL